jgi:hypothetical protein
MTRLPLPIWIAMLALTLVGCSGTDWSRNLYEGVRQQQTAVPDPKAAQPATSQPEYDVYQRERERLKSR